MQISYAPSFTRSYRKLSPHNRMRVDRAIEIFENNPFDPKLRNHKLSGLKQHTRSISAAYDLRILYFEQDGHAIVIFVDVGSHNEVN